jgi:metalloprotease
MKLRYTVLVWALILAPYSASQTFDLSNLQGAGGLTGAGAKVLQAAVLSNADIKALSDKACAQMDSQEKSAPASSAYEVRFKENQQNTRYVD